MPRRRLGLILPSMNTTLEPDFNRSLPSDVTVHAQRLWAPPRPTADDTNGDERLGRMNDGIPAAVDHLMTAQVELIVYGCTSGSFSFGAGGESAIGEQIHSQAGVPVVVTSHALLDAIGAFGARRLAIASPYPKATNDRLVRYLEAQGYEVVSARSDPYGSLGSYEMVNEEPAEIRSFAVDAANGGADLLVCPCTAWRALEVVASIEDAVDMPVVTSNQAAIWASMRALGTVPVGPGSLFNQRQPR